MTWRSQGQRPGTAAVEGPHGRDSVRPTDRGLHSKTRVGGMWRLLQLGLTVAAVAAIGVAIDWPAFLDRLRLADLALLALAALLYVFDRLLMSYKWGLLLAAQGAYLPLLTNWGLYALTVVLGTIMPSSVGGDALRVTWLWRRGVPTATATASIVLEKLVGSAVALGFTALALVYLGVSTAVRYDLTSALVVVVLSLVGVAAVLALSFRVSFERLAERLAAETAVGRLLAWARRVHAAYRDYGARPWTVAAFGVLTVVEYVLILVTTYVMAAALGIEVALLPFAAALTVAMLVARLPVSIDGIGVFEGVFILLLALHGIDPASTLALAIVARALSLLLSLPPALGLLAFSGRTFGGLRADARMMQGAAGAVAAVPPS